MVHLVQDDVGYIDRNVDHDQAPDDLDEEGLLLMSKADKDDDGA